MTILVDPAPKKIFTVSELTTDIKRRLETIGHVWVAGEVSNARTPASGHTYFTLKDPDAQIAAVLFAGVARSIRERPENGVKMRAFGRITVYPPNGNYQIIVEKLEREGKGTLQEQFDQLKAKLRAEGLIDRAKQPLPRLPRSIAMVTSPTGAVIRDMLKILDRRFSQVNVLLVPVKVQGEGAAQEIAGAIRLLNDRRAEIEALNGGLPLDVLIVARGGGSLEDLWAFNEEIVARAIAGSRIPVVSAVGHETDTTIADYVADLRAPTPSAAAELVVPVRAELLQDLARQGRRLGLALSRRYTVLRTHLDGLARRPVLRFPEERVRLLAQRLDDLGARLPRSLQLRVAHARARLDDLRRRPWHARPGDLVRLRREPLSEWGDRLARASGHALTAHRQGLLRLGDRLHSLEKPLTRAPRERLSALSQILQGLSPLRVLARGYTLTKQAADDRVLSSISEVRPGDRLRVVFRDGAAQVWVEGVEPRPQEAP